MKTDMTWAWPAALALSAFIGSWALACMLPFAAVATLAAATMPARQAAATVMAVWAINQIVGFTLLSYPHSVDSYGWGLAVAGGAAAALAIARSMLGRAPALVSARTIVAFLAAFAAYELLLYGLATQVGGTETFAVAIVRDLFANEIAWLGGLGALYVVLSRAAPRLFATRALAA